MASALPVRPAHRFVKVLGLCDQRRDEVVIECHCGHVSRGESFVKAASDFERHKVTP